MMLLDTKLKSKHTQYARARVINPRRPKAMMHEFCLDRGLDHEKSLAREMQEGFLTTLEIF